MCVIRTPRPSGRSSTAWSNPSVQRNSDVVSAYPRPASTRVIVPVALGPRRGCNSYVCPTAIGSGAVGRTHAAAVSHVGQLGRSDQTAHTLLTRHAGGVEGV